MKEAPREEEEPAQLRLLRRLVTVLTATMIVGLLVVIGLLVIRLTDRTPALPESIALPDGAAAVALTQGPGWYAVVTDDDRILIFDRDTGALRQSVRVDTGG
ncbi:hypothetical protein DRV85_12465 [Rhodosalinus halophilus]|jgi:hypothetical protein|uniref:Uncharacterized protein n=1 Tax=Rhodosalinus halophilus TaxID=2259333 RepID=A0A365U6S3_9RHOB|nr:DUF6476 family protein [Rhodosalinus halophilus]RBI84252.1 hypothetical protein DRV85_12465 [Rhodosalinus halophilus]